MVKRGDSLAKIAAQRNGLSVPDLARLNRVTPQNPLRVGQPLMLPKQSYLDAGRAAKNKLRNCRRAAAARPRAHAFRRGLEADFEKRI